MAKFGERLKELRLEKGLFQEDLAKALGFTQTTIGKWENGVRETDFDTLVKIADFFDVSTDYILGRED